MNRVSQGFAAFALLPHLVFASACASSLREPPSLQELAGKGPAGSPKRVETILAAAEAEFAKREPRGVREAARLWVEAASTEDGPVEALMLAARATIWLVDHCADPAVRKQDSTEAVQIAQWCGRIAPEEPGCDYWLGAALGVQARERRSTAVDALPRIVKLFRAAAERDPALDEAGPDRALALLFVRAPGWPTGPGDPDLGLEHARRAVELRPDYPPNLLALAEALESVDNRDESLRVLSRALEAARRGVEEGAPDAQEWLARAEEMLRRPAPRS